MQVKNINQKRLLNINKFYLSICLLFLIIGNISFAQDPQNSEVKPIEQKASEVTPAPEIHDTEVPKTPPVNKTPEVQVQKSGDGVGDDVEDIDAKSKALEKAYSKLYLGTSKANEPKPIFDHESAIKEMALQMNKDIKPDQLKKMKIHVAVELALKPLQSLSEEQILTQLLENTKDTPTHEYFKKFPKLTIFAVRMIKDDKAISDASKIIEDRDRMINYSALMICTFFVGIFLKRLVSNKSENPFRIFVFFIVRIFIMIFLRLGLTIYFFGNELTKTFNIFMKTFFN